MRNSLISAYLDYVNNYLTVGTFAEHYGLTEDEAESLIELGKSCNSHPHPEE